MLQKNIANVFAEYDNLIRIQRVTAGMKARLKEGLWPLNSPLGYYKQSIDGSKGKEMSLTPW